MDQDDLAIYATDQFSKAEEFKSLSQQKEETIQNAKDEKNKIEQQRLAVIQKNKDEEEKAKKMLKLKIELKKQRDKNVQQPVPIDIPEVEVDLAELKDYSLSVAKTAERNEPEEAVQFPDSTPLSKVERDLDIADVDISGTDLSNSIPSAKGSPLGLVLVQLGEEGLNDDISDVEIDDGSDTADSENLQSTTAVQTDSDMQISDLMAVEQISENAMAEVIADKEPEKVMSSPELDDFLEASEEQTGVPEDKTQAMISDENVESNSEKQANMRAFGQKLGIDIPGEVLALTDNAQISAGLVETAINCGKSEGEISQAMGA